MKHKVIVIKNPIPDSVYAEALLDDDGMPFDVVDYSGPDKDNDPASPDEAGWFDLNDKAPF